MTKEEIRTIVREEIAQALGAISRSADYMDMPYETAEIDSRVYSGAAEVARRALVDLKKCWTEGHTFAGPWGDPRPDCDRCGAPEILPENPFKESND